MKPITHTPAPWRVKSWPRGNAADGFQTTVTDNRGHGICTLNQYGYSAKAQANARLISAAPTMLDALIAVREMGNDDLCPIEPDVWSLVVTAIEMGGTR